MRITEEYYELFWINPGTKNSRKNSCTPTYLPSQKPFKEDEHDMETMEEYFEQFWINSGSKSSRKISSTASYLPSQKPPKKDEQDERNTTEEARTNS